MDTVRGGPHTISLETEDPPARDAKLVTRFDEIEETLRLLEVVVDPLTDLRRAVPLERHPHLETPEPARLLEAVHEVLVSLVVPPTGHEAPNVPNYGRPGKGLKLKVGMALAIEPMFNLGTEETLLLDDGWTVVTRDGQISSHFEHTVAVTAEGPLVLTLPEPKLL